MEIIYGDISKVYSLRSVKKLSTKWICNHCVNALSYNMYINKEKIDFFPSAVFVTTTWWPDLFTSHSITCLNSPDIVFKSQNPPW